MWKSHYSMDTTTIGHYDLWHSYSDQVNNNNNTVSQPPLNSITTTTTTCIENNNDIQIRQTPSVSLLRKKGLFIHSNPDYLHNRPFSPFSGYYGENDIYLGCEYDIFGSEPMIIPPTSITNENHQQQDHLSSSYNNDPFSIPPPSTITTTSSSSLLINNHCHQQPLKRLRDDMDININQINSFHNDKKQCIKNGILSKEIPSSSFNHHSISSMNDIQLEYC